MKLSEESNQRFSRNNRLSKSHDLYKCYRFGSKIKNDWLAITVSKNILKKHKSFDGNVLGVIIKRKTFKRAVERNLFKRVVREYFRINKKLLPKGVAVIISVECKPLKIDKLYFRTLITELFSLVEKK